MMRLRLAAGLSMLLFTLAASGWAEQSYGNDKQRNVKRWNKPRQVAAGAVERALAFADKDKESGSKKGEAAPKSKKAAEISTKEDKPRLPRYFGKLELSEAQREKVYNIQGKYADDIAKLEKQLADIKTKRDNELQKVLSADQKKQYAETVAAAKAKMPKEDDE